VLIATLVLTVLQVTGTSMEPTLQNGQIVVAVKNAKFQKGNIVAFYYNNKILLKRVIAKAGDTVIIQKDGTVLVNGKALNEPYLKEKSQGKCDIQFPYQVPDGKIFVLGDHRATSVDSRSSSIGCIENEFIVGKVVFRVWPLPQIGMVGN
jgi:signal peptidase I